MKHDLNFYERAGIFDKKQLEELKKGLDKDLDVEVYAISYFSPAQMKWIRIGLEKGLPVKHYAKSYFGAMQMQQILRGLEAGLIDKVDLYAKSYYSSAQMYQLIEMLLEGTYSDKAALPENTPEIMEAYREAKKKSIDLSKCTNYAKYTPKQVEVMMRYGLLKLNAEKFIEKGLDPDALLVALDGIKDGYYLIPYVCKGFNKAQMVVLLSSVRKGIRLWPWVTPLFSSQQMNLVMKGLEENLDVSQYARSTISPKKMQQILQKLRKEKRILTVESLASADNATKVFADAILKQAKQLEKSDSKKETLAKCTKSTETLIIHKGQKRSKLSQYKEALCE